MEKHLKVSKSDKFNVDTTASLSLFLYPDSTFIFAKDQNGSVIAIHEYALGSDSLPDLLEKDELLQISVPLKAYSHNSNFTLVPGSLFVKGEESTYLGYVTKQDEGQTYFSTGIESNKIQLVGATSERLEQVLSSKFTELSIQHGAASFLSYLFHSRPNLLGQEILVNLLGCKMYAAAFTDQELVSFAMFDLANQEDLIKYPRAIMAQHGYNPAHARLTVIGKSEGIESGAEWGKEYFHQYVDSTPKPNQNLSSGLNPAENFGILEAFWQFD